MCRSYESKTIQMPMHDITPSERKRNEHVVSAPQKCIDFILQYSRSTYASKLENRDVIIHLN